MGASVARRSCCRSAPPPTSSSFAQTPSVTSPLTSEASPKPGARPLRGCRSNPSHKYYARAVSKRRLRPDKWLLPCMFARSGCGNAAPPDESGARPFRGYRSNPSHKYDAPAGSKRRLRPDRWPLPCMFARSGCGGTARRANADSTHHFTGLGVVRISCCEILPCRVDCVINGPDAREYQRWGCTGWR